MIFSRRSLLQILNRVEEGVIALLLGIMTLVTFLQVVVRYVFHSGLIWAVELTTYAWIWLVVFGMSYGVKAGLHIGVDIYVRKLSPRKRRFVGLVAALLCVLYAVIVFVGAWHYFVSVYTLGIFADDLPIERWKLLIILPVGFGMLFWRLTQAAVRIWIGKDAGLKLGDETSEMSSSMQPPVGGSGARGVQP